VFSIIGAILWREKRLASYRWLHQHRRPRRVVDDIAQHVEQQFGAADLRRLHEDHPREGRRRTEAVNKLTQEGRPGRPPPARLARRNARKHAILIGPLADGEIGIGANGSRYRGQEGMHIGGRHFKG
jgi:hypothetical protein